MANIQEYLNKILLARFGKDVRGSIHDAIQAMNTQVEDSETSAAKSALESAEYAAQSKESAESIGNIEDVVSQYASEAETSAENAALSEEQARELVEQLKNSNVTGIKGSEESDFRTGNVTISAENVGAVAIGGDIAENVATFNSGDNLSPTGIANVNLISSGETIASIIRKVTLTVKNVRYLIGKFGTTDISAIGDGTLTGGLVSLNDNLDDYINAPHLELSNATGIISSYKVTKYFACCTMEITPTKLENDSLLAWGLWGPDKQLFLTLPTIGGGNIPCTLTTNGELRVYYTNYTTLERIDFTFMYPTKR